MAKVETSSGFPIKENPHIDGAGFDSNTPESKLIMLLRYWNPAYHLLPFEVTDVTPTGAEESEDMGRFKIRVTRMRKTGDEKEVIDCMQFFSERQIQNAISGINTAISANQSIEQTEGIKDVNLYITTEALKVTRKKLEGMQKFSTSTLGLPAEPLG